MKDTRDVSQAIVKVLAGQELGLPPFASMTGIHIVQGKPVLGSNVIATLVSNDPRFGYRVLQGGDEVCQIEWYEHGKVVGNSSFTMTEAKAAGLAGKDNWKKYPSDMLFARAISRGARRYAPGIFGGSPVYTPDEFDLDTDPEGFIEAEIIEHEIATATENQPPITPEEVAPPNGDKGRSWPGDLIQRAVAECGELYNHPKHIVFALNQSPFVDEIEPNYTEVINWLKTRKEEVE